MKKAAIAYSTPTGAGPGRITNPVSCARAQAIDMNWYRMWESPTNRMEDPRTACVKSAASRGGTCALHYTSKTGGDYFGWRGETEGVEYRMVYRREGEQKRSREWGRREYRSDRRVYRERRGTGREGGTACTVKSRTSMRSYMRQK